MGTKILWPYFLVQVALLREFASTLLLETGPPGQPLDCELMVVVAAVITKLIQVKAG
jgi:hypothetical protein